MVAMGVGHSADLGTDHRFLGANGESHFNIAIRTITLENGIASFHAGAGIVADSVPQHEWEETLHKAAGILTAAQVRP